MNRGVCILPRHCCCTRSHPQLDPQLQTPALLGTPNIPCAWGRLALLSQHQPGCEGGQLLAWSMAASSKAVVWCHCCSLGVEASLGFAPCPSFWETKEQML